MRMSRGTRFAYLSGRPEATVSVHRYHEIRPADGFMHPPAAPRLASEGETRSDRGAGGPPAGPACSEEAQLLRGRAT